MARKSRATGVGRGNGPGSARTQFQDGMPSANGKGRPRKEKLPPPNSLQEAVARELMRKVEMTEGSRKKKVTQLEAMVEVIMNEFPKAKIAEKMRLLRLIKEFAPDVELTRPPEVRQEAVSALVARLAQEAERYGRKTQ